MKRAGVVVACVSVSVGAFECPAFLKPICKIANAAECLAACFPHLAACIKDSACRENMKNFGECMQHMPKNATADQTQACLVPNNELRSDFLYCIMDGGDKGACVDVPVPPTNYPKCQDDTLAGDPKFNISNINGLWHKVSGWKRGEVVECLPCQTVEFWDYDPTHPLPWPSPEPPVNEDTRIIQSKWYEYDSKGKYWPMTQTSLWGPRAGRKGFPTKEWSTGTMFGLGYNEQYTVIHDGSHEKEPFLFMYACGETKQGKYTSGLVLAKVATSTSSLRARIDKVATDAGFKPSDWCDVDNSCKFEASAVLV